MHHPLRTTNNLATKNTTDFTILDNGDAFISQRKVASLVGVSQQAVNQFCLSNNLLVKHGVNSENLSLLVTNYAQKGKSEAIQTLILFAKAGAKAYIYQVAELLGKEKKEVNRLIREMFTDKIEGGEISPTI